jgi:xanthine/uracil permease
LSLKKNENKQILYGINDFPPIHKAFVLSLQHVFTMFGATIAVPLLLGPAMNMTPDQIGNLISSVMLCAGIVTLLQVLIGSGLPIIQGVSFSFLAAFFQIINAVQDPHNESIQDALKTLGTDRQHLAMQYIAGAIICGSLVEMLIGWGGLIGRIRKLLSPVVVGPVVMLIGLALYPVGVPLAKTYWPISLLTILSILIFSQILSHKSLWFRMFPILFAIVLSYLACWSFTTLGMFPLGYALVDTHTLIDNPATEEIEKGLPTLYGKSIPTEALPSGYEVLTHLPPLALKTISAFGLPVSLDSESAWLVPSASFNPLLEKGIPFTQISSSPTLLQQLNQGECPNSLQNAIFKEKWFERGQGILPPEAFQVSLNQENKLWTLALQDERYSVLHENYQFLVTYLFSEAEKSAIQRSAVDPERFHLVNTSFLSKAQLSKVLIQSQKHPAAIDYSTLKMTPYQRNYEELFLPWGTPILPIANLKDPQTGASQGWGFNPFFKWAFMIAILAGFLASIIESFGDYHSCALLAGAGLPTPQQINKGIGAEGLGCFITGLFGGFSSTSYSENIGLIGITKVGSKYVVMLSAVFLLLLGFFSKFGAFAATIPTPIVGALYCTLFGLIAAIGIQQVSRADLTSDRNLMIIGFTLFMGLSFPFYIKELGSASLLPLAWIDSLGYSGLTTFLAKGDEILKTILGSGMAVAAILGLILDNLIPGSFEERGLNEVAFASKPPSSPSASKKPLVAPSPQAPKKPLAKSDDEDDLVEVEDLE